MSSYPIYDEKALKAQRAARNMVERDRKIIRIVMVAGILILLMVALAYSSKYPIYLVALPLILYYLLIRGVINWRQWAALLAYEVKCPYCKKPVATRIYLYKTPTPNCPHCGKRALATLNQLDHPQS